MSKLTRREQGIEAIRKMAGPPPAPKDMPGAWVLECGKHKRRLEDCCGDYTAHWRWCDVVWTEEEKLEDLARCAQRCVTHHAACDCQEWKRVTRERELLARIAALETALEWYADEERYQHEMRETESGFEIVNGLSDDCGSIARAALEAK